MSVEHALRYWAAGQDWIEDNESDPARVPYVLRARCSTTAGTGRALWLQVPAQETRLRQRRSGVHLADGALFCKDGAAEGLPTLLVVELKHPADRLDGAERAVAQIHTLLALLLRNWSEAPLAGGLIVTSRATPPAVKQEIYQAAFARGVFIDTVNQPPPVPGNADAVDVAPYLARCAAVDLGKLEVVAVKAVGPAHCSNCRPARNRRQR